MTSWFGGKKFLRPCTAKVPTCLGVGVGVGLGLRLVVGVGAGAGLGLGLYGEG